MATRVSLAEQARYCITRLVKDSKWMVRRKHRIELLEPTLFRHHLSFDFELPDDAPTDKHGLCLVPLLMLRKAPGEFFRFDFRDATGLALSLPTRDENGTITAATLLLLAEEVAAAKSVKLDVQLAHELRFIAHQPAEQALSVVVNRWMTRPKRKLLALRRPKLVRTQDGVRGALADNNDFWWLLRAAAYSSIILVHVPIHHRERQLLKLSYDEVVPDLASLSTGSLLARTRALMYWAGYRSYPTTFLLSHAAARSFHFELHAPDGLAVTEAGLTGKHRVRPRNRRHIHLYDSDSLTSRVKTPYVRFRIRGTALSTAALLVTFAISLLLFAASLWSDLLAGNGSGSAPSLLLLFPGLIATYLAHAEHPVTLRLLGFARLLLVIAAISAYVAAGKLALISSQHPATEDSLHDFFAILRWIPAACFILLLLGVGLPRIRLRRFVR